MSPVKCTALLLTSLMFYAGCRITEPRLINPDETGGEAVDIVNTEPEPEPESEPEPVEVGCAFAQEYCE